MYRSIESSFRMLYGFSIGENRGIFNPGKPESPEFDCRSARLPLEFMPRHIAAEETP